MVLASVGEKVIREKQLVTYKESSIRLIANFSETLEDRRQWTDIFKVFKEKYCQPRILYQAKLFFKEWGEIKTFLDKQKPREFVASTPVLQEMLKVVL